MKSFQTLMILSIATVVIAGFSNGRIMVRMYRKYPHPSMEAASSRSAGIFLTNPTRINTIRAILMPELSRI
ncbi:hypothetical protein D3C84_1263890 [compost metagenome]